MNISPCDPFPSPSPFQPSPDPIPHGLALSEGTEWFQNETEWNRLWFHKTRVEWNGVWFDRKRMVCAWGEGGSKAKGRANQMGVEGPIIKDRGLPVGDEEGMIWRM